MKKLIIIILTYFFTLSLNAQEGRKNIISFSTTMYVRKLKDNGYNIGAELTLFPIKSYYITSNLYEIKYHSPQKPLDYYPGFFKSSDVCDKAKNISISIGKLFLFKNRRVKIGMEMGLNRIKFIENYFIPVSNHSSGGWFSTDGWGEASHSTSTKNHVVMGYTFKTKLVLPITNSVGFALAYRYNYSSYKSFGMGELAFYVAK